MSSLHGGKALSSDENTDVTSSGTSTLVDMGEDLLLEKTLGQSLTHLPLGSPERETAILKSADILLEEGLSNESKKMLRKLLRENPNHVRARQKLKTILEEEIQSILRSTHIEDDVVIPELDDSGETLRALEKDLDLGVAEDSFLEQEEAIEAFRCSMRQQMGELNPKEMIDMGIGFLEMGMGSIAQDLFEKVQRMSFLDEKLIREDYLSATYLLAQSFLSQGCPLDAIRVLERVLADGEFSAAEKCDGAYLLGQANEAISQWIEALGWYEVTQAIDSSHRDIEQKIPAIRLKIIRDHIR